MADSVRVFRETHVGRVFVTVKVDRSLAAELGLLKAEAEAWRLLSLRLADIDARRHQSSWPTVGEYWAWWWEHRYVRQELARRVARTTTERDRAAVLWRDHLKARWAKKAMTAVTRADVLALLADPAFARYSHKSQTHMLGILRQMFTDAQDVGLRDRVGEAWILRGPNPTFGVVAGGEEAAERFVPTQDEVERLFAAAMESDEDLFAATYLAAKYGLRISEVTELEWRDVIVGRPGGEAVGTIRIRERKNGRGMSLPLMTDVWDILTCLPKGRVLVCGMSTIALRERFNELRRQLDMPDSFTMHSLRHYAADRLARSGAPISTVQASLGHESVTSTEHYLRSLQRTADLAGAQTAAPMLRLVRS